MNGFEGYKGYEGPDPYIVIDEFDINSILGF
jgi:hypothetical protein